VPKLKVMARATVFTYKGKQPDPKQVGRDLQVRAVLMGRVAQRGDNLSVQVDLVDARDGSQIWGRQYNRKSVEMQTVQEEIARQATDKMRMKLSGEAESRMAKRSTQNPEAYKLYLQGRFSLGELTEDNVRKALAFFEQAIAKDPDYALGHAGLADAYSYLGHLEIVPPKDAFPKAKDSALRALQLDPALAEAHASLGILHLLYDWDWPGAETELRRAMELNPGNAYIRHWFAHYLETMGRLAEAQVEMERALDMDPLSDMIGFDMVLNYSYSRQREKALEAVRKAVQLHPHNPFLQASLGYVLADAGKREEAIAELQKAAPSADIVPPLKAFIASTYALAGKPQEARKMLAEVEALAGKRFVSPYYLAEVHFALGDTDQGFAALNRAYELRSSAMTFLVTDPVFGRYRSDPRFIALLKKLNLPVEPKRAPL
jgi:Tfp pilus assembly protein PilF